MRADRKWVERNLGFDPIAKPPPLATFAFKAAAEAGTSQDFQREIIDFDSESTEGLQFLAFTTATGLSRYTDVPWPKKLAPKTGPKPRGDGSGPLPRADVLLVTWTVDEGHTLSRVLTPGEDSRNDYLSYTHNFATISKKMRKACPALQVKRLGAYWTTSIGGKSVEDAVGVTGPIGAYQQLPDSNPIKKVSADFIKKYEDINGKGSWNSFAAFAYDAVLTVEDAIPRALQKAKPGTPEFRAALRDEIRAVRELPGTNGVYAFKDDGSSYGVDDRSVILVQVKNGDWKLLAN